MSNESKIYVSKEGYEQYIQAYKQSVEELKAEMAKRPLYGRNTVDDPTTVGYESEVQRKSRDVADLQDSISRLVVIENGASEEGVIGLGDTVAVMDLESNEVKQFKLSGGRPKLNLNGGLLEITINSPMGKALFKSKVGDTVSYSVGTNVFSVYVVSKENGQEKTTEESQPE